MRKFSFFWAGFCIFILQIAGLMGFAIWFSRLMSTDSRPPLSNYRSTFEAYRYGNLGFFYSLIILCILRLYECPGGFFLKNTQKCYKICQGILIFLLLGHLFLFGLAVFDSSRGWRYVGIVGYFLSGTAAVTGLLIVMLAKQKREYLQLICKIIELNAENGVQVTEEQAATLYKLQAQKECLEKVKKHRESKRRSRRRIRPIIHLEALQSTDYYQLSKWLHLIEESKSLNKFDELVERMEREIRSHLTYYNLDEKQRRSLKELADMDELLVPQLEDGEETFYGSQKEVPLLFDEEGRRKFRGEEEV